jgi:hypothetical protein
MYHFNILRCLQKLTVPIAPKIKYLMMEITTFSCINSKFIYQPCGHIVTGNVNVVHDKEAKHVLQKRPTIPPPSKII